LPCGIPPLGVVVGFAGVVAGFGVVCCVVVVGCTGAGAGAGVGAAEVVTGAGAVVVVAAGLAAAW
jgi:hypothetical protein